MSEKKWIFGFSLLLGAIVYGIAIESVHLKTAGVNRIAALFAAVLTVLLINLFASYLPEKGSSDKITAAKSKSNIKRAEPQPITKIPTHRIETIDVNLQEIYKPFVFGFKFGLGFCLACLVFWLIFLFVFTFLFGMTFGALLSQFAH